MIPRYSRPDMVAIWSPETRFRIWFEIEAHATDALAWLGVLRGLSGKRLIDLEVDGGVSTENAKALVDAGANLHVAGTSIFARNDPKTYAGRNAALGNAATVTHA